MVAGSRSSLSQHPWAAHYPPGVPTHLEYPTEPVSWLLEQAPFGSDAFTQLASAWAAEVSDAVALAGERTLGGDLSSL